MFTLQKTAEELRILKVGLEVNTLGPKANPRFQNFQAFSYSYR